MATSSAIWVTGTMQSEDIFFSNGGNGGGSISTYPSIANSVLAKVDIDNGALLTGRLISGHVGNAGRDTGGVFGSHLRRSVCFLPGTAPLTSCETC